MDTKTFILDFADEPIVQTSINCTIFKFQNQKRKRNKKTVTVESNQKPVYVSNHSINDDIQFYLDLFSD
jgi:hypothetical protein